MPATEHEIVHEFRASGHLISDQPELVTQCAEICSLYGLTADELVLKWETYLANNMDVEDRMTMAHLQSLKRQIQQQQLQQQQKQMIHNSTANAAGNGSPALRAMKRPSNVSSATANAITSATASMNGAYDKKSIGLLDDSLLDMYQIPEGSALRIVKVEPSSKRGPAYVSPESNKYGVKHEVNFSPSSFSPVSQTPSKSYSERFHPGKVEVVLNEHLPSWIRPPTSGLRAVDVQLMSTCQVTPYRYMFQKLSDKAEVLDSRIEELASRIKKRHMLNDFTPNGIPSQELITVSGRVCCDSEGKLNEHSVVLEGSRDLSSGARVRLDLGELEQLSLFPGQIIAVEGYNAQGDCINAIKLHQGAPVVPRKIVPQNLLDFYAGYRNANQPMTIFVASGPFTPNGDVSFAPLGDLVTRVNKEKPDILMLLGPFIDSQHSSVVNGEVDISYTDWFQNVFSSTLLDLVASCPTTRVLIVPSMRDVLADDVFPQSAFPNDLVGGGHERIFQLPNPCTFMLNEVAIAVSTNDILFHLGSEEISRVKPGETPERLSRLANHLLEQRSFYPLFPPAAGANIEFSKMTQFSIPLMPDLLILPSELKYFAKTLNQVTCVNPGRLVKGESGGTFSRLTVFPPKESDIPHGGVPISHNFHSRTKVEIIRI